MHYVRLFVRFTCAKIAFVTGLGLAPAIAAPDGTVSSAIHAPSP